MTAQDAVLGVVGWTAGCALLVPQGLVALGLLVSGADQRSWFLALHLPTAGGALVAVLAVGVGTLVLRRVVRFTFREAAPRARLAAQRRTTPRSTTAVG